MKQAETKIGKIAQNREKYKLYLEQEFGSWKLILQVLFEGKITAVKMKTVILSLASSSDREERIKPCFH